MITRRFFLGLGTLFTFTLGLAPAKYKPLYPFQFWGTYGKSGKEPLRWVQIDHCSNAHIEAILTTQHHIRDTETEKMFENIMSYRERHGIIIEDTA